MATGNIPTRVKVDVENGVFYPEEDDTRPGKTQDFLRAIIDLSHVLADRLPGDPRAFAAGDLFLDKFEGD